MAQGSGLLNRGDVKIARGFESHTLRQQKAMLTQGVGSGFCQVWDENAAAAIGGEAGSRAKSADFDA